MNFSRRWPIILLLLITPTAQAQTSAPAEIFVGSTPADAAIRTMLRLPQNDEAELLEWKLILYRDPRSQTPSRYALHVDYGMTTPNRGASITRDKKSLDRQGTWTIVKGRKSDPAATVYALDGLAFAKIGDDLLHPLDQDRTLMVGDGGRSYTLSNVLRAEKNPDLSLRDTTPSLSYTPAPRPSGASAFGVFAGRTVCQGIARELHATVNQACVRLKWSIRLQRDPATGNPTTYRIEGSLYGPNARTGTWTIVHGRPGSPDATIYRLSPSGAEPVLSLLKGDDNVLFMLDQNDNLMIGNADLAYTLDRELGR